MSDKKAIVIGAGMSGIMATKTLHEAGIETICLEARERVGGRTHTDNSLGVSADLGASWIHGPIGNPLKPIADELGIQYGETDFVDRSRSAVQAYDADGTPLNRDEYAQGQLWAKAAFIHAGASLLYKGPEYKMNSFAELYDHGLPKPENMTRSQELGFHYYAKIRTEYSSAADAEELAWGTTGSYEVLPGDDLLLFGGGYNTITDHLTAGLDIRTGQPVQKISLLADGSGVELVTLSETITADYVVVTVPLGVLKSGAIQFYPPLPEQKQAAIDRIGFGNYEKIVMRFDKFYWPKDRQRLNFLSTGDSGEPSLFHAWLNIGYYTGEPVIVAYHAGKRARHINSLSDGDLIERALDVMQKIFGDNGYGQIPAPEAYVRTGWQSDPYSNGSYSFDQVGQLPQDRRVLGESIADRIFFAGEATHPSYYATVHAAYETGIYAARQILDKS